MQKRFWTISIMVGAALFAVSGFAAGYAFGSNGPSLPIPGVANALPNISISKGFDFGLFWDAWRLIDGTHYKAGDTDDNARLYGAIRGLVGALDDPYSSFFTPEENKRFTEAVQGAFGGVGIEIGLRDGRLVVVAPLKDTPGDRAGLLAGDTIVQIDGEPTDGISIDDAVNVIRGDIGAKVTLSVIREEEQRVRDIEIIRDRIEVPALDVSFHDNIAHIELYGFTAEAGSKFSEVVNNLPQGTKGIILDLRNNPGGFLEVAVDIAGHFIPKGALVVSEADRNGKNAEFKARGSEKLIGMPVVVIINQGSASASEILAGALRDVRGATLVGETSFGKGTVQEIRELPGSDGASIKITVAEWLLPKGDRINGEGLTPDIEIAANTDPESDIDPQFDRALGEIRQQIGQ